MSRSPRAVTHARRSASAPGAAHRRRVARRPSSTAEPAAATPATTTHRTAVIVSITEVAIVSITERCSRDEPDAQPVWPLLRVRSGDRATHLLVLALPKLRWPAGVRRTPLLRTHRHVGRRRRDHHVRRRRPDMHRLRRRPIQLRSQTLAVPARLLSVVPTRGASVVTAATWPTHRARRRIRVRRQQSEARRRRIQRRSTPKENAHDRPT